MTKGIKVQMSEFAETPMEGVEQFLSIAEQEIPNTEELGEEEVVIAVKSAAIGWVDLMMLSGQYQHQPPLPFTPGLEYCGTVLWKGKKVADSDAKIGDNVLIDGSKSGPRSPGKYQRYGGFATYAVAPKEAIIPIPERLNFDQACNLLGSYETAYYCLITNGQLKAGETVLIHGASGATGMAAVHIAKLIGATVIATGRSDEKLATVKAQGADYVINTKATSPDEKVRKFRADVKALTNGK
ncbi:MAG: zinc-binding dehydrogenase, partial [Flavobacteriales bacterium]|nr:zinc-binding dehydrogenase [Flavobacteriales bacterium]